MDLPFAEPYKIKMVETIKKTTPEERVMWLEEAHFNLFNLSSDKIFIDFLTDSGTGAMSDVQWSEMMKGDESYAGSASFQKLKDSTKELLGFDYVLPAHQGRAAENVLFSVLVKDGDIIPGNTHFITTRNHIESRKGKAVNCTVKADSNNRFNGNIDLKQLKEVYANHTQNTPFVLLTVTCNIQGGQPVSMENIREVAELSKKLGIKVLFDAARFAENAYFIKKYEAGYADKSIKEIVKEMFSYVDGCVMSSKKDGIVNMGGFIGLKDKATFDEASKATIFYEGYITYGGMAGRDMAALAQGLQESTEADYLESRVEQVAYLGKKLEEYGVPVLQPFGGHGLAIDAQEFFPHIPKEEFPAQLLAAELYIEGGIRGVELGSLMMDNDPETGEARYASQELYGFSIPRRVYTNNHMNYVAAALRNVFERRNEIKRGLEITCQPQIMRTFSVQLRKI